MASRPENGLVGLLLITSVIIISWWVASYAHSYLPPAKLTGNGNKGNKCLRFFLVINIHKTILFEYTVPLYDLILNRIYCR